MPILPSQCYNRPTLNDYALCRAKLNSNIRHRHKILSFSIIPRHVHGKNLTMHDRNGSLKNLC